MVAFGTAPHFGSIHARLERRAAAQQAHVLAVAFYRVAVDHDQRAASYSVSRGRLCRR